MVLTMTGTGVFAADNVSPTDMDGTPVQEDQINDVVGSDDEIQAEEMEGIDPEESDQSFAVPETEEEVLPEEEEVTLPEEATEITDVVEETEAVEPTESGEESQPALTMKNQSAKAPAKVTNLRARAGYLSIQLVWNKSKKATYYVIKRSPAGKNKYKKIGTTTSCSFTDTNVVKYHKYKYKVYAAKKVNGKTVASGGKKITEKCVGRLRINITLTKSKTFTRPNGSTFKLKKGTRIRTEDYGGGKYKFYIDGVRYSVPRVATKDANAFYMRPDGDNNYGWNEATFFINRYVKKKGIKSNKKYLIWVSTDAQHLYVFKKKNGKWKPTYKDWEISMGRASTPSPTGNKTLHKKIYYRHGINYWNCYSSLNALHGVSWGMSERL